VVYDYLSWIITEGFLGIRMEYIFVHKFSELSSSGRDFGVYDMWCTIVRLGV